MAPDVEVCPECKGSGERPEDIIGEPMARAVAVTCGTCNGARFVCRSGRNEPWRPAWFALDVALPAESEEDHER